MFIKVSVKIDIFIVFANHYMENIDTTPNKSSDSIKKMGENLGI